MDTYKLAQLIRKIVPDEGAKILPTFRRLVESGELTPERVERESRGLGTYGTIAAFRLIGYMVTKVGRKWVIESKGESTWF